MTIAVDGSTDGGLYTGTTYSFTSHDIGTKSHRIAVTNIITAAVVANSVTFGGIKMHKVNADAWNTVVSTWVLYIPDDWSGTKTVTSAMASSTIVVGNVTTFSDVLAYKAISFVQPFNSGSTTQSFSTPSMAGDICIACATGTTGTRTSTVGTGETKQAYNAGNDTPSPCYCVSTKSAVSSTTTQTITFNSTVTGMGFSMAIAPWSTQTTPYMLESLDSFGTNGWEASPLSFPGVNVHGAEARLLVAMLAIGQPTGWKTDPNAACTIDWGSGATAITAAIRQYAVFANGTCYAAIWIIPDCPEGDGTLSFSWTGSGEYTYVNAHVQVFANVDTAAPIHQATGTGWYSTQGGTLYVNTAVNELVTGVCVDSEERRTLGTRTGMWQNQAWQGRSSPLYYIPPSGDPTSALVLNAVVVGNSATAMAAISMKPYAGGYPKIIFY